MAQSVLIYEGAGAEFAGHAKKWADQWANAPAEHKKAQIRTTREMTLKLKWVEYVTLVGKACRDAGKGGELLMLVGHGGDITTLTRDKSKILSAEQELAVGMFDLGPCKKVGKVKTCDFRQDEKDIFYDYAPPSTVARAWSPMEADFQNYNTASKQQKKLILDKFMEYVKYRLVGHCAQGYGLRQIVLLNCNVGNATTFMQKVANDWQLPVVAFTRRLETREEEKTTFIRMYAAGEQPGEGSNQHGARYNYPQMHARTFKPNGPAALPFSVIYNWMYPPKDAKSVSTPPGKGQSAKPVKVGAR